MAEYGPDAGATRPTNTVRLWSGGIATAVVAALVNLVGALLVRGVLGSTVLAPEPSGRFGDPETAAHAALAGFGALAATGLLHLLLNGTPRPLNFFGWIVGLATALATIAPFAQAAPAPAAVATALVNLATGATILALLGGVGTAVHRTGRGGGPRGPRDALLAPRSPM